MNSRNELNGRPGQVVTTLPISPVTDAMLLAKVIVQRPKKSIGKIIVSLMNWFLGLYSIFAQQDLMTIKKAINELNNFKKNNESDVHSIKKATEKLNYFLYVNISNYCTEYTQMMPSMNNPFLEDQYTIVY